MTTPPDLVEVYGGDEDHFRHVLATLLAPAARQAGFDVVPPMVDNSDVIQAAIMKNLDAADLVLCDMSALNPNVFFELGIRVALDRPVAMVKDDVTRTPFDNASVGCHTYAAHLPSWDLRDEIERLAGFLRRTSEQTRNAMWQHYGPAERTAAPHHEDARRSEPGRGVTRRGAPARATPAPAGPRGDFDAAVDRLLDVGGMTTREWTYELRTDRRGRAVWLTFRTPPSEFLEDVLRKEATRLGLTLHLSRRRRPSA